MKAVHVSLSIIFVIKCVLTLTMCSSIAVGQNAFQQRLGKQEQQKVEAAAKLLKNWQPEIIDPTLANGVKLRRFNYYLLMNRQRLIPGEFDFTDEQGKRIKKLYYEFRAFCDNPKIRPRPKNKPMRLDAGFERLDDTTDGTFYFPGNAIAYEGLKHYFRVRKVLTPHQRKRLDQLYTWAGRSQRNSRFAQWVAYDVLEASKLPQEKVRKLIAVAGEQEKLFRKKIAAFQQEQNKKIFAVLTEKQKQAYLHLIDPKREIAEAETSSFEPDTIMGPSWESMREMRLTEEQNKAAKDLLRELEKQCAKHRNSMSWEEQNRRNLTIDRFELYRKEFAPKMAKLLTPRQLGIVERRYIKHHLNNYGPAAAIFDPAMAALSGISMDELRAMDKLKKKLKKAAQEKKAELTKQGYENILKNVDRETRRMLKKYFGKPPVFVLQ